MGSLRLRVPVQGLAGIAALTLLQTSCGASVRSAAQSRKLERNPCGTVGIRNSLNRALRGVACSRTPLADWHAPLRPGRVRFRLGQNFQRTRRQRHPVLHTLRRNRPHPGLHVNLRPARPAHLPRTGMPSATGTQGPASPMPPPPDRRIVSIAPATSPWGSASRKVASRLGAANSGSAAACGPHHFSKPGRLVRPPAGSPWAPRCSRPARHRVPERSSLHARLPCGGRDSGNTHHLCLL